MPIRRVSLSGLEGLPLIKAGDDLGMLLASALRRLGIALEDRDILVVAQNIVSKAEGRTIDLRTVVPSARAVALAAEVRKDPRLVEVILSESTEVIRSRPDVLIVAHRLGFVMANAGVDQSNVGPEWEHTVLLLPQDPNQSAARLKAQLDREFDANVGIVVSDSFGRPWRQGVTGVALGSAGVPSLWNLLGAPDLFGRAMRVTEVAVADELAAAAALVMGESNEAIPAVHIRGAMWNAEAVPASTLIRPREMDLFR